MEQQFSNLYAWLPDLDFMFLRQKKMQFYRLQSTPAVLFFFLLQQELLEKVMSVLMFFFFFLPITMKTSHNGNLF